MQSIITLSTTEAEYVALSTALRDVIYILQLTEELTANGITVPLPDKPRVTCRVFEDNAGAVELANNPKLRPRTKHIAIPYHHFRHHVAEGTIKILPISTKHQIADIFTKPLWEYFPFAYFTYNEQTLLAFIP